MLDQFVLIDYQKKMYKEGGVWVVQLKAYLVLLGEREAQLEAYVCCNFFSQVHYKIEMKKESELFRQPNLSILISHVQFKSAPWDPGLFLVFWFNIFR